MNDTTFLRKVLIQNVDNYCKWNLVNRWRSYAQNIHFVKIDTVSLPKQPISKKNQILLRTG